MSVFLFHPALILTTGAIAAATLPGRLRRVSLVVFPSLALAAVLSLEPGTTWVYPVLTVKLVLLKVDALSKVFGVIFSLIALFASIYALHIRNRGEHAAALLYAAGSLGVVFAGDWLTLVVFWESMSITSVFLIWYRGKPRSLSAGFRYLLVHTLGGNALLAGVVLYIAGGGWEVGSLAGGSGSAFWLILFGFAVNAAIPPLHAWLTDAYPEATVTGSVFLSAFTTKVAVYTLIRVFPGVELLVWAGVIMALYGVVFAFLENNIRRLLAYHIVSQVGYMVAAAGMGTAFALNGGTAHAFSHILYKALLFMGAGAVIYATGREKLTDLGGIARYMPWVVIFYTIGAFSISGVPFFNGFISKSIVIAAAGADRRPLVELLLELASVGTFLSISLKLLYFMFFGPARASRPVSKIPLNMYVGMGAASVLCIVFGLFPALLYNQLPYRLYYEPYTVDHLVSSVQLLLATAAGFWLLLPKIGVKNTISLDTDWFYRRPLAVLFQRLVDATHRVDRGSEQAGTLILEASKPYFNNPFLAAERLNELFGSRSAPRGLPGKSEPVRAQPYDEHRYRFPLGVTVFWVMVIFGLTVSLIWIYQG